jgi:hypothetical protein
VGVGQPRVRRGEVGRVGQHLLEQRHRLLDFARAQPVDGEHRPLEALPAVQGRDRSAQRAHPLHPQERRRQGADDALHEVVLHGEEIAGRALELLGQDVLVVAAVDELDVDPDAVAGATDAALEQEACPELAAEAGEVVRAGAAGRRRVARDHREPAPARQARGQLLHQGLGEVGVVGVRGEVVEGQDRDGGARAEAGHVAEPRALGRGAGGRLGPQLLEGHRGLGAVGDLERLQHRRHVHLHGAGRDPQDAGDLAVREPAGQQLEHLELAGREQPCLPRAGRLHARARLPDAGPAALNPARRPTR